MSQGLWVEHKTDIKTYIAWIPIKDYEFVGQIIKEIKENTHLAIPKNAEITLHGPSGTAISPTEPISVLIPGNSVESPYCVQVSTPPPVTTKPAFDAKLTSFWSSLHGLRDKEGILDFPVEPRFISVHLKKLYIRESYKDLFKIICENRKLKEFDRLHRMAITGTSGIGKSAFLIYILWRLANEKKTKTVIYRRQNDGELAYVFQNDGCWETSNISGLLRFFDDPDTWYLTDSLMPPPEERNATTILVSSPVGKFYKAFLKYSGTAPLHYLPVWSLKELKLMAPYFGRKPRLVESRFAQIGGIPRYVLEKNENLEVLIKRFLYKLSLEKLGVISRGELSNEDETSHLLVQFQVNSTYSDFTLDVGSDYIMDKILTRHVGEREQKVRDFIADTEGSSVLSGAHARAFKGYAHRILSAGGKFLVRSLDDGETHELNLSKRTFTMFYDFSECDDPEAYYKPSKVNNPCVDSIILNVGYFQMTTTLNHSIKEHQIRKIVKKFRMDTFYFVVPDTIFEEFQRQKFEGNMENVKTLKSTKGQSSSKKRSLEEDEDSNRNKKQRLKKVENNTVLRRGLVRQFVISVPISRKRDNYSDRAK